MNPQEGDNCEKTLYPFPNDVFDIMFTTLTVTDKRYDL